MNGDWSMFSIQCSWWIILCALTSSCVRKSTIQRTHSASTCPLSWLMCVINMLWSTFVTTPELARPVQGQVSTFQYQPPDINLEGVAGVVVGRWQQEDATKVGRESLGWRVVQRCIKVQEGRGINHGSATNPDSHCWGPAALHRMIGFVPVNLLS